MQWDYSHSFNSIDLKLYQNVGEYYQMCSYAFGENRSTIGTFISILVWLCFLCKIPAINLLPEMLNLYVQWMRSSTSVLNVNKSWHQGLKYRLVKNYDFLKRVGAYFRIAGREREVYMVVKKSACLYFLSLCILPG